MGKVLKQKPSRQGLKANPDSHEILLELGRLYSKTSMTSAGPQCWGDTENGPHLKCPKRPIFSVGTDCH
jgi:hypothetical protein